MALVAFGGPLVPPANAGFGPSSRAVVSPVPGLAAPKVQDEELNLLSDKKLRQLIGGALSEARLEEFSVQIDSLANSLNELLSSDEDGASTSDQISAKEARKVALAVGSHAARRAAKSASDSGELPHVFCFGFHPPHFAWSWGVSTATIGRSSAADSASLQSS